MSVNKYTCKVCESTTFTRKADEGVIPGRIRCTDPHCPGNMISSFYDVPEEDPEVTHEWFIPSRIDEELVMSDRLFSLGYPPDEINALQENSLEYLCQIQDYLKKGGLILRSIQ